MAPGRLHVYGSSGLTFLSKKNLCKSHDPRGLCKDSVKVAIPEENLDRKQVPQGPAVVEHL